jgi:hypothetical protein
MNENAKKLGKIWFHFWHRGPLKSAAALQAVRRPGSVTTPGSGIRCRASKGHKTIILRLFEDLWRKGDFDQVSLSVGPAALHEKRVDVDNGVS